MSSANGYSVVPVQGRFLALRIKQMVFALVVLGISAYHCSLDPNYDAGALSIFTAIATVIFVIYWFVANSPGNTNLYNYWAIFAVELFVLIFWLCSFALTASKVALIAQFSSYYDSSDNTTDGSGSYCYDGYCAKRDLTYKRDIVKRWTDPVSATLYTALALSVANFVLFAVTFTLYTIKMFRHRAAQSSAENNNLAITNGQGAASQMEKGTVVNRHQ